MTRMTRALYERLAEMGDRDTRVYISFMVRSDLADWSDRSMSLFILLKELYNELIRDLLKAERNGPLELLEVNNLGERGIGTLIRKIRKGSDE